MTTKIALNATHVDTLDLSPVKSVIEAWIQDHVITDHEQTVQFDINYPQAPDNPQEWSEIPAVRLWFIRLDSVYPWLPLLLDWRSGELVRYAAMLVPHEFKTREGIQFNPQALDIFVMQKLFVITHWLHNQKITSDAKLKQMAEMFGYELDTGLFDLLRSHPT